MQFLFWRLESVRHLEHRCDVSDRNGLEDGGAGRLRGTEPQDTSRQTTFDVPFQDCAWCQHCPFVFALCSPAISPAYLVRQGQKSTCTKDGAAAKLGRQSSSWVIALLIARLTFGTWLGNCDGVCGSNHADGAVGRSDKQRIATTFRTGEVPENVPLPPDYNMAPTTFSR